MNDMVKQSSISDFKSKTKGSQWLFIFMKRSETLFIGKFPDVHVLDLYSYSIAFTLVGIFPVVNQTYVLKVHLK